MRMFKMTIILKIYLKILLTRFLSYICLVKILVSHIKMSPVQEKSIKSKYGGNYIQSGFSKIGDKNNLLLERGKSAHKTQSGSVYICMYMYVCIYTYTYIWCIYIYNSYIYIILWISQLIILNANQILAHENSFCIFRYNKIVKF